MDSLKLAVPSSGAGGMDAPLGMHFGKCDVYTIVDMEDGSVKSVSTLENLPHSEGGCLAPVDLLAKSGVNALLAGGMGKRPLAGFKQAGVDVFFSGHCQTVGQAVEAFASGKLEKFPDDFTCGCSH